jgi:hypothetical protein
MLLFLQLACVLTSSALMDWIAMSIAVALSSSLIAKSVLPSIVEQMPTLGRLAGGGVVGAQILFGFLLKMYFFRRISYY